MRRYRWGETVPKPISVSAPEYVDLLMSWVEQQLGEEALFPTDPAAPFPKDFKNIAKNICKRLFRIYAHTYYRRVSIAAAGKTGAYFHSHKIDSQEYLILTHYVD